MIEKLKKQRAALKDQATALVALADTETRNLTAEERTKFDGLMDQITELDADITRREKLEALVAPTATTRVSAPSTPGAPIETSVSVHRRYAPLRAFKGPDAEERAYRSGAHLAATVYGNTQARQWCNDHNIDLRAQSEGVNTAGGFVTLPEFNNTIIDLRDEYGLARQECFIAPMSSDTLTVPRRTSGLTAYFPGEAAEVTESSMAWDQVNLVAKKAAVLTRYSSEISEDSFINMADTLADEAAYAFAAKEDACLVDGDGSMTYGGMIGIRTKMVDGNHAGSYADATAGDDQFTELLLADIVALVAKLPTYAIKNAKWYFSQYGWGSSVTRLLAALGGNAWGDLTNGGGYTLAGYPVKISTAMPSATTAYNETVMLMFGDMRSATTFGDRRGITVKQSDQRYLEYDQIGVLFTERFDIVAQSLGSSTAAGPLVALRGNTA